MTTALRPARRTFAALTVLATSVALFAACSASHEGAPDDEQSVGTAGALVKCPAGQHSECNDEIRPTCTCVKDVSSSPPPATPPPSPGPTPQNTNGDVCKQGVTPPPGLPGCQPALQVNGAKFVLCPFGTPIPAHIYCSTTSQVNEWDFDPTSRSEPRCDAGRRDDGRSTMPPSTVCYFRPADVVASCVPSPPYGWVYLVETGACTDDGGGGCGGPCGLCISTCKPH